jgi:uncharacterized GH25 family protein
MRISASLLAATVTALTFVANAGAHDFWLMPPPSTTGLSTATIKGESGDQFPVGTDYPPPDRVDQWFMVGADGKVTVSREFRREGDSLVTEVILPRRGVYLGVMTSKSHTAPMKAQAFTEYLREEGLENVIEARRRAGEAEADGRERYSRYAKVVLRTGAGNASHVTRPTGLKSELVPSADPSSLRVGDRLTVQLLTDGRPVRGVRITGISASATASANFQPAIAVTDAEGKVTFTLDQDGAWLIRTLHMVRVRPTDDSPADWESYWVTLSFRM